MQASPNSAFGVHLPPSSAGCSTHCPICWERHLASKYAHVIHYEQHCCSSSSLHAAQQQPALSPKIVYSAMLAGEVSFSPT
jgi:uncharacterized protein (DUF983 family)